MTTIHRLKPPSQLLVAIRVASDKINTLEQENQRLRDINKMLVSDLGLTSPYSTIWPWVALVATFTAFTISYV